MHRHPPHYWSGFYKPKYKFPGDYVYITKTSSEHMCVFTGADNKIQSIEQLVDEGKKRTVNISVSRLPHSASIATLSLAEATGARFNIVPFGGRGPLGAGRAFRRGGCGGAAVTGRGCATQRPPSPWAEPEFFRDN